ncbi:MAG TPA: Crp/Fnr family transcriptional regulator [Chitinispirillaceae bacterium]|jgi:CRP/FNR family transcriptional regulator/CRP/FNR family cyclic AMP-dependent transcriptional regulator|nr:Crp/Fnr family transcriptional regulator [Chitinispirillaceae bacterium]
MNQQDIKKLILKVPLFKNLNSAEHDAISSVMVVREYDAGQIILHEEDEETQTFFILVEGSVHVTVLSSEGKQTILATLRRGEFFGEMAILDGEPRSASVVSAEKCVLLMLYRKSFLELLQKYPSITIQMMVEMSRRLRRSNRHINTLSMMSVCGRVADVLLQMAKDSGRREGKMIIIENRPTHQVIADMAGTSRETVSRILSQLQRKQLLTIDRKKLVILNEEKLYF